MSLQSFFDPIIAIIPRIPETLLSLFFGYILIRIMLSILARTLRIARMTKGLRDVMVSMAAFILWAVLIAVVARNLGLSQIASTIAGSLVVVGFALANGASSFTADILSGLMLAKDPDFKVGYRIKIGDIEGEIEKMDIRKIRILNKDKKICVIANSQVDKGSWVVISRD